MPDPTQGPELRAQDLEVQYPGSRQPALRGVSLAVPQGSFYAVLGPNGSGKSTLLRALLGLIRPMSGHSALGGLPSADWSPRDRARRVGVVPQGEVFPFPMTVRDLVAMGRYPHLGPLAGEGPADRDAIAQALHRCDATALAHRMVDTLSGGELQRVRIARALAQEPSTLVLDEPTASLDLRHEMEVLELLRGEVGRGKTVLLTTHHLDLAARYADRILILDGGAVAAEGPPAEVLTAAVVEAVFGWPVVVAPDPVTGAPRITPLDRAPRPGPPGGG
jgi:iron complex transport system ATP-binding protein